MNKYAVIRNTGYSKSEVLLRQRHNERENESYSNEDIDTRLAGRNVYFKKPVGTYCQDFDRLVDEGVISTRGLQPDADVFCEFVFDVNSQYFDVKGGYDFAKMYFEDAYKFAIQEAGDERYILSAVMHADEINRELTVQKGYPIYHYHMHVVYIPVVEKEIRWSKRCKDPELVGKIKETIHQVSRSKKWASPEVIGKNGKPVRIPSYALLQDRYFEYMSQYYDLDRGREKSNRQHLSTLEYKVEKEQKRLSEVQKQVTKQEAYLNDLCKDACDISPAYNRYPENIKTKKTLTGKIEVSQSDYDYLCSLGKEAISSRQLINSLKRKVASLENELDELQEKFDQLMEKVALYLEAVKLAPHMIKDAIQRVFQQKNQEIEIRKQINRDTYSR